jgi:phosphoglycolate phosphatase-like HAD superfamily hydrolase
VIHDIDGTHSLIRDWIPAMCLIIDWAMTSGLDKDFDSDENLGKLAQHAGKELPEEIERFCIESAGLSSLTQMEYGIRRAVQEGNIPDIPGLILTPDVLKNNAGVADRIVKGEERFDDVPEPLELTDFISEQASRLFLLYEKLLDRMCRDRNTALALKDPEQFRVPGSLEFITYLHSLGLKNYFVTGSVIRKQGGMTEEVQALGFETGPGKMVERLIGSSLDKKRPKDEVIENLLEELTADPCSVLIIGDGRREIMAGVEMGSITMSRLPADAHRLREIHIDIGTNYIVHDYTDPALKELIQNK